MVKQISILDEIASREERDKGITLAVTHADNVEDGWSDGAYNLLKKFLSIHVGSFQAEEFRSYCAMIDFPLPPHARAFGGIMLRARNEGIIKKVGVKEVRNPKAHRCFSTLWVQSKNVA